MTIEQTEPEEEARRRLEEACGLFLTAERRLQSCAIILIELRHSACPRPVRGGSAHFIGSFQQE